MLQRRETAALVYGLVMAFSACADDDAERFHNGAGGSNAGHGAAASGGSEAGGESGNGESGGNGGAGGDSSGGTAAHGGGGHGGHGGNGGSGGEMHDAGVDAQAPVSALHIDSFPPLGAESGVGYRYRVVLDRAGAADYQLVTAPAGAIIDDNGIVTWTPSDSQTGGTQLFDVRARLDGLEATQEFSVSVPAFTLSAEQLLPADDEHSAVVSVTSPLSPANGVSVKVPAGALSNSTMLQITTASGAPDVPAAAGANETPLVLGFGPSGSVFKAPVELLLPLSAAAKDRLMNGLGVASAWTLGADGRWQSLPIAQLDLDGGYVLLRTEHFSLFSVFAAPQLLIVREHAQGGLACSDALFWNVGLTDAALSTFNSTWLNGTTQAASSSLAALLGALPAGQRVQLALRAQLSSAGGSYQQQRYRVFDFTKRSDGRIGLQVQDGDGNVLLERIDLAPDDASIPPILIGDAAHFVLRGWPSGEGGHAIVDAFAYWRSSEATPGLPATEGQAFASLSEDFDPPAAGSGDDDCDGLRNASDPTPQGLQPPSVNPLGASSLRAIVDTDVVLAVQTTSTHPSELQLSWSSDAQGVQLTPSSDGRSATFRASRPGAYKVVAMAKDSAGSAGAAFTIFVDAVATGNTLPRCKISAAQTTVWSGDSVLLRAVVADAEQNDSELSVSWAAANGGMLSSDHGRSVSFTASTPASYEVSCVANDGIGDGPRSTLSIAVTDRPQNTPPRLALVTPTCATIKLVNGIATQTVNASATDVDGDTLHFQFDVLGGSATTDAYTTSPDSAPGKATATVHFQTDQAGSVGLLVRAIDQNGAASEAFAIKLLVVSGDLGTTDADGDGFPAGVDCNDADKAIYPGAPDACGDGVDQNCDGHDRSVEECDADGDGQSISQGDCDDTDANVHAGAFERCNGKDDNCNGDSDEGFTLGADCKVGRGACVASGSVVCSPDGLASLCNAKPNAAAPETCNGIDDDCNGSVDDVASAGGSDLGNCGGCGMTCTPNAHQIASCNATASGARGCSYACSAAFIDLDRNPQNGCEYGCQANSQELCNGADDDCDGKIDEETATPVYSGPNGTLGIGDCRSGLQTCNQGQLVVSVPPVTPGDEHCDGRDNDCDGKIDEDFHIGDSCDGPDSDLCAYGKRLCNDQGSVVCGLEVQHDLVDVCDGIDNDCNPKTEDGSADAMLGAPCDEQNPSYCEPGTTICSEGELTCSSDQRDRTSCKVCACDVSARCDTNGEGSFCGCDPQCVGPDVGCFCDLGKGCDLVDGVNECGCDRECVGQTPCSCDHNDAACDVLAGFYCACDAQCATAPRCGCDANAGLCDKTLAGDNCLCDADCYGACFCDDHIADTCAVDSDHHACRCDPSCSAGGGSGCACDKERKSCDQDPQTQAACACDPDCKDSVCACNTTAACDKTAGGDACLCDDDCYGACACDDRVSNVCAHDSSGNACTCDPDCSSAANAGCGCDQTPGTCDTDSQTGMACKCDMDCSTPVVDCLCDTTSGTCEKASGGDACLCDRDCYTGCSCDDHDPDTCALDSDGHACKCDPGCPAPTGATGGCDCNTTDACDRTQGGTDCLCDDACYSTCACDDHVSDHCATDSDGHVCQCDAGCQKTVPTPAANDCACDKTSDACNLNDPGGDKCLCDPQCYPPCPCADDDPNSCRRDSDGNACRCDPGCGAAPVTVCECNTSSACDAANGGGSCLCDVDCYPDCPCDDHLDGSCARDSAGNACVCDRDCSKPAAVP